MSGDDSDAEFAHEEGGGAEESDFGSEGDADRNAQFDERVKRSAIEVEQG